MRVDLHNVYRRHRRNDTTTDSGAVLLLAIGFVLLVSAISAALAALIMSSTSTGSSLEGLRNRQYAADDAIQDAITKVRFLDRSIPPTCGYTGMWNGVDIRVDCANAVGVVGTSDNDVLSQRNVIFLACATKSPDTACAQTDAIIRAQVNFEQKYDGVVIRTFIQSWSVNQ